MKVTVLGAGSWGTTLALVLVDKGHQVNLWTYNPRQAEVMKEKRENHDFLPGIPLPPLLNIATDIEAASVGRDLIVAAVPSQFLRSVLKNIAHLDLTHTVICNVAKGVENQSLMTMSEVMIDILEHERKGNLAILSGPSHAEEVSKKIPTAVVASSYDQKTARLVQDAFMTPYFRVYVNDDIRGVELGGAIKNVIAIAAGVSDGAGFGDNTKAAIMTRGIYEITRLGVKMGAQPITFAGLSGIGDLIVTCMSRHSRNRYVGEEIGKGRKLDDILKEMVMVAEGVTTTKAIHELSQRHHVDMPMAAEVYSVLYQSKDPYQATYDLMTRDAKGEGSH
ncbi:MAG: NAD(P)H-dependent glycerol-3-phosphate dehydrogenase [Ignavibacteriales bacterium]|nr:NAD(P)H-dependent glycerol-3-phosphate dehydrogenase [Ignavibacteriales bacterium]